ncbi:DUF2182 domain-containing protein [Dyadobacter sp. CY326]|uniref:DUF2182 domain-containing protein n=1 Tax=Dyadobacter sp. CY326 TaxID=2907300 RepID=UPI001F2ADB6A|nr:DUF2182 domain-containing protein [Dyadobacter sp. CY326]MCE7066666.1 DUF2182 domain-containing protein [Dyadobacter sp. CY326]
MVRTAISRVILGVSIFAWVLLLINPGHIMSMEHCHVSDSGPSVSSLHMLLEMNPIASQLTGWGLMVVAMMFPKLIIPIQHIYARSLRRTRFSASLLFAFGYMAVWMAVGLLMIGVIMGLHLLMPGSYLPVTGLAVIAIIWQFSPVKQRCLNRGHNHLILATFGWAVYRDALLFGVIHGIWCVGAGWALMLLPMLLPSGHTFAMLVVTFIMLSEHLEHPKVPRWHVDFRAKLFRMIVAQIQIRLKEAQE